MCNEVSRRRCRSFLGSSGRSSGSTCKVSRSVLTAVSTSLFDFADSRPELQGHAIKNKDLLAASGAITLKGADSLDELQEDEQAVRPFHLQSQPF